MSQIDLFSAPQSTDAVPERRGAKFERWARELDQSGDYRILRRLVPRPAQPGPLEPGEKMGVLVDVETTGLDHTRDEIIELGMVAFTYDATGKLLRVVNVFSELRQPRSPIPAEIARLTGITDEMVAGKTIDADAVVRFIGSASIVITIVRFRALGSFTIGLVRLVLPRW